MHESCELLFTFKLPIPDTTSAAAARASTINKKHQIFKYVRLQEFWNKLGALYTII